MNEPRPSNNPGTPGRGAEDVPGSGSGGRGAEEMPGSGSSGREAEQAAGIDVEKLLADALRPIEPPERLSERVESTLSAVTQAAADELSDWADELSESELRALGEPRNWVRPVVAVAAGGVATGVLVLFEARRRGRQRGGALRSVANDLRSRL